MAPLVLLALALVGGGIAAAAVKEKGRGLAKSSSLPDLKVPSELYQRAIKATQISDPAAMLSVIQTITKSYGQTWIGQALAVVMDDTNKNALPSAKSEAQASLATTDLVARLLQIIKDGTLLLRYAGELEKYGLPVSAGRLRDRARTLGAGVPGLPANLQQLVARAQELNTPEAYSSAAYALEQAGYPESAKALRDKAAQLSQAKGAPPASSWPNQTTDPQMDPALAAEVARVMRDSADPKTLRDLSSKLRALGYTATADQLDAKAAQVEATHIASTAMQQTSQVMQDFGLPTGTPGAPATPASTIVLPEQTILAPKSQETVAAQNMTRALYALLSKYGDVKTAKKNYAQAQGAVLAFQKLRNLGTDGLYGSKTAIDAARFVDAIPIVLYWAKAATKATVSNYLSDLETMALAAEEAGLTARAESLRASAQDEITHGIGPGEPGYGK